MGKVVLAGQPVGSELLTFHGEWISRAPQCLLLQIEKTF